MTKKWILRITVIIVAIALIAAIIPGTASAKKIDPPGIAHGNWTAGTESAFDFSMSTFP
jgi:hypothetical protein